MSSTWVRRAHPVEHHLHHWSMRIRVRVDPIALPMAHDVIAIDWPTQALRRDHAIIAAAARTAARTTVSTRAARAAHALDAQPSVDRSEDARHCRVVARPILIGRDPHGRKHCAGDKRWGKGLGLGG